MILGGCGWRSGYRRASFDFFGGVVFWCRIVYCGVVERVRFVESGRVG